MTNKDLTATDYIKTNEGAPADSLIRAIFAAGCTNVRDLDGEEVFKTAEEALVQWYGLDDFRLGFTLPDRERQGRVRLTHQYGFLQPHVEDVSDWTMNCDSIPEIAIALDVDRYSLRFRF